MSIRELMKSLSMGCGESLQVSPDLRVSGNTVIPQKSWLKTPVRAKKTWGKKKA
ncbi:MAG: hypothetical protein ACWA5Q_03620 [bacterium]